MNASTRFSNAASSSSTKSARRSGFLIVRARASLGGALFLLFDRFLATFLDLVAMDATGASVSGGGEEEKSGRGGDAQNLTA